MLKVHHALKDMKMCTIVRECSRITYILEIGGVQRSCNPHIRYGLTDLTYEIGKAIKQKHVCLAFLHAPAKQT